MLKIWVPACAGMSGAWRPPPIAALVFYRAFLQGGATAPIDALVTALAAEGIAALPIFVASLKERACEAFLAEAFAALPPAIVLNTTAFAVSKIGAVHAGTVLDRPGKPVLQVILAGSSEAAWRDSPRGLQSRDLTMDVVLPEVDGRLGTRAISFKAETARPADAQPDHLLRSRSPTASPSSPARPPPGYAWRGSRPRIAGSPSSSPTTPTATAASPTASASTPPKAPPASRRPCAKPATTWPTSRRPAPR